MEGVTRVSDWIVWLIVGISITWLVFTWFAAAANSLSVSRSIYRVAVKNYEAVRYKPVNRLPAFLLGYRTIPKTDGP